MLSEIRKLSADIREQQMDTLLTSRDLFLTLRSGQNTVRRDITDTPDKTAKLLLILIRKIRGCNLNPTQPLWDAVTIVKDTNLHDYAAAIVVLAEINQATVLAAHHVKYPNLLQDLQKFDIHLQQTGESPSGFMKTHFPQATKTISTSLVRIDRMLRVWRHLAYDECFIKTARYCKSLHG
jgi:hypothetical protein